METYSPNYVAYPPVYGQPVGPQPILQAPVMQAMTVQLETLPGVVIRQESQWAELIAQAVGIPYEEKNKYKISALPAGKHAAKDQLAAPGWWKPTGGELIALPEIMRAQEESTFLNRCLLACLGCVNLRPLTMHFLEGGGYESLRIERPFHLGGCCCCPLEMTVLRGQAQLGKVLEDFAPYCLRCLQCCCLCTFFTKVLRQTPTSLDHRYTLRVGTCCCGRVNNCCGATCLKNDLIIDILDAQGKLAATIQKTYAPSDDCSACCRCVGEFSNYIVEFPPDATEADRALLMAAVLSIDYQLFEKDGSEDNNNNNN